MKIVLLGAKGQVGSELQRSVANIGTMVVTTRNEVNFESLSTVRSLLLQEKPHIVINAVAYTQVDKAELEPELAHRVNVDTVEVIANEVKKNNGLLIHYSTDYVFDGKNNKPYYEKDRPNPLNVYGKTKWLSEQVIAQSGCNYLIFRTSWIHAPQGNNFINTFLKLMHDRETIHIVDDQTGTPTSAELIADITAQVLRKIVSSNTIDPSLKGIYHLTACGMTNWYDYACLIVKMAQRLGHSFKGSLIPIRSSDYKSLAIRPTYSVLNTEKLRTTFNIILPDWELLVRQCLTRILRKEKIGWETELL